MADNEYIVIKGASHHNLKNIDLKIPRNQITIITGLSGSGKSSLAFDTLYAEGQRRYIESLSSYARQFLGKIPKPQVKSISNLPPAVAIQQKVATSNPRSTVGTVSEIYDYMKLLFARIGRTYSPTTKKEVKKHSIQDVVDYLKGEEEKSKIVITAPLKEVETEHIEALVKELIADGYSRYVLDGKINRLDSLEVDKWETGSLEVVIDRFVLDREDENQEQFLFDSARTAFSLAQQHCKVHNFTKGTSQGFSAVFEEDGVVFIEPSIHLFDFNNPLGACSICEGYGKVLDLDVDLIIPNKNLSIFEDAIAPWKTEKMSQWKKRFIDGVSGGSTDFPIHKPYFELSQAEKDLIWHGNQEVEGIFDFFKMVEENLYKVQYRVMYAKYRAKTTCRNCEGQRLRKEANYVRIDGHSISELVDIPVEELAVVFDNLKLSKTDQEIADLLLTETKVRIKTLNKLGLGYLTLNRVSATLSGGEYQRINLANCLNSQLVGTLYVLDEPSIGLHPKDTANLIEVIKELRDMGNTIVIVEHDDMLMKEADYLVDIGPKAGALGGELLYAGKANDFTKQKTESYTYDFLTDNLKLDLPEIPIISKDYIEINGARHHNLKNIDLKIPLHQLVCITGISGSGKSTLVRDVLYPALQKHFEEHSSLKTGEVSGVKIHSNKLRGVEFMDQKPIGKSSRSNPVTYLGIYDDIRNLMASQRNAKIEGITPKHFSFNVDGGRCDECKGEGEITLEMQFMADVKITCEECEGTRFKKEVLGIEYHDKNIDDILNMTIQEAYDFFKENKADTIARKISSLVEVGLGYLKVGQSSNTLSGGEAQRVKLAYFLSQKNEHHNKLYIFDEPTTGLHYYDISLLMKAFAKLIENENSVILIEHNMEVVKESNWIIDIGPEAGKKGGEIVAVGTPSEFMNKKSYTARALQGEF